MMTVELWILVATAALHWTLVLTAGWSNTWYMGVAWTVGNRAETLPELPAWVGRAQKASRNLQENLAPFAMVVVAVVVAGKQGPASATGAAVFLGARIAHALFYLGGIRWARSASYAVSMGGVALVLSALFG